MKVKIHDIIRKDCRERNEVRDEAMRAIVGADLAANPGSGRLVGYSEVTAYRLDGSQSPAHPA